MRKYIFPALLVLFLIALFFRLYRIEEFITFLGDQGRDAIVLKRILTLEHLPAIGASSSIGGVFLGPFYYYFIAPWLLLFNFNPVGPAVGVAIFSSFYVLINYFIVKELLDEKTAFISSILITFSLTLIYLSRFSWNPNLLPLFSLTTIYFFIKAFKSQKSIFYLLAGAFLAFSIQLHYLALLLIPPIFFYFLYFKKTAPNFKINIKNIVICFGIFTIISFPLIIFDLRHQFLNTKSLFTIFGQPKNYSPNRINAFLNTFKIFCQYIFNIKFSINAAAAILVVWIGSLFFIKRKANFTFLVLTTIFYLLGASLYGDLRSSHYYATIYSLFYIVLAYYLSLLDKKKTIIAVLLIIAFIFINGKNYFIFTELGANQIKKAKAVAEIINKSHNKNESYSLVSLPELSSDAPYRYYLEVMGNKPVERDIPRKTDLLYIVCEHPCQTIGNPQWDVAYFAPKRVDQTWQTEGVTIYKLSH